MDNFGFKYNAVDFNGGYFKQVLTVRELAVYLKCNSKTIYNMVEKEQIPYFRVGKSIRFRLDSLEEWMNGKAG